MYLRQSHTLRASRLHKNVFESTENSIQTSHLLVFFFKLPTIPKWNVPSSSHTAVETDPSQLPLDDSSSDLGEPLLI